MQRQRGEQIERNFAHQFDSGGLDRLYVRPGDSLSGAVRTNSPASSMITADARRIEEIALDASPKAPAFR
jgi:hypothetical protein